MKVSSKRLIFVAAALGPVGCAEQQEVAVEPQPLTQREIDELSKFLTVIEQQRADVAATQRQLTAAEGRTLDILCSRLERHWI